MPEVTARVERIQNKKAKNNDVYKTINLKGQKKVFFDWEGHCEAAGITEGDTVRIEHDGSGFPRVTRMEKVADGESLETEEDGRQRCCGEPETRMCALICAALVLHGSKLTGEEITAFAEKLEKWITG